MKTSKPQANLPIQAAWFMSLCWLVVIVLLTRPYRGIFHDGHLYLVQALRRLDGSVLNKDVFFAFGNQDSFSVFTWAYAPVISALGVSAATILFYSIGLAVWMVAVLLLACALLGNRKKAVVATAFALCLYPAYGNLALSYGEGFVSPRIFSEASGLIAIAFAFRSRFWLAAVWICFAVVLHPLMGISALALCLWLVCTRKRWFFVAGGAALGVGLVLGAAGFSPFSWIFQSIDESWMALIEMRAPLVLISEWSVLVVLGWLPLPLFSLILIWRHGPVEVRDLALGVLVIAFGFSLLSLVLGDLFTNRFFVGIQLWRAQGLLAFFGNLLAIVAMSGMRPGRGKHLFVIAMVLSIFCYLSSAVPLAAGLMATAAAIAWLGEGRAKGPVRLIWQVAYCIPFLAAVLFFLLVLFGMLPLKGFETLAWLALRLLLVGVSLGALVRCDHAVLGVRHVISLAVFLLAALSLIDLRTDRQLFWAEGGAVPPVFEAHLNDKTVYWEGELVSLWAGLRMPQYYSCRQSGGMVFFQEQANEIFRRADILRQLNTVDFDVGDDTTCPVKLDPSSTGPKNAAVLSDVCRSLPELDRIILKTRFPGLIQAEWTAPFSSDDTLQFVPTLARHRAPQGSTSFYLYDCDGFR